MSKIPSENIPPLFVLVENHFKSANHHVVSPTPDNESNTSEDFIDSFRKRKILRRLSKDFDVLPVGSLRNGSNEPLKFKTVAHVIAKILTQRRNHLTPHDVRVIKRSTKYKSELKRYLSSSLKFEPVVEGRSIQLDDEAQLDALLAERKLFESKLTN